MKNSRNTKIETADLIEALRRCFRGDVLLQEAASRLAEYTDRCARYAEEIAVLKAAAKPVTNCHQLGEWIPVTERLPEEDGFVIVWHDETEIALFSEGKFCFYDAVGCLREYVGVTHWMPLPTPPKGE